MSALPGRPAEGSNGRVHRSLLADMHLALLAEIGARAIYPRLAARTRDAELAQVLARFHEDECEQVERMRALMAALGKNTSASSLTRSTSAWLLALATRAGAMQIVLRMCCESEKSVARWYAEYAQYLDQAGERAHAVTCESLSLTKQRHARVLQTWVAE